VYGISENEDKNQNQFGVFVRRFFISSTKRIGGYAAESIADWFNEWVCGHPVWDSVPSLRDLSIGVWIDWFWNFGIDVTRGKIKWEKCLFRRHWIRRMHGWRIKIFSHTICLEKWSRNREGQIWNAFLICRMQGSLSFCHILAKRIVLEIPDFSHLTLWVVFRAWTVHFSPTKAFQTMPFRSSQ